MALARRFSDRKSSGGRGRHGTLACCCSRSLLCSLCGYMAVGCWWDWGWTFWDWTGVFGHVVLVVISRGFPWLLLGYARTVLGFALYALVLLIVVVMVVKGRMVLAGLMVLVTNL
ncbi:hypothetical protein DFS34DRAFT_165386 [Phlyctochytrium arcticum]|nr:hypothetical protein DFS34DRAFT_165386 [Phlyctochytrium arcticum]